MKFGNARRVFGAMAFLAMLAPYMLFGQTEADTGKSELVHLDHAEIVNAEIIEGREYLFLRENVELSQDSIYFYCDSARIIDQREVAAFGQVIIQKGDSLEVFADTLLYFSDTRIADLTGDVALVHGTQQLWTTHLNYDMNTNIARYDEPARLIDSTTQLSSKQGVYWVDTEEALFIDSVVVIDEGFSLTTDSLRYNAITRIARFIAPTWIYQDGAEIYCEDGFYDMANRKAEFRQNPEYRSGEEFASAQVMTYDDSLKQVMLIGEALYTEADRRASGDTITYNQQTGDVLISGNGEFKDAKRHLRSGKTIRYNRETEKVDVAGRGVLTEGSQIVEADFMDINEQTGIGNLAGNVVMIDTSAQTRLESDSILVIEETGYMKAFGNRRPVLKSLVDADTLYVTSELLISYEERDTNAGDTIRHLTGYDDVRIFRGTLQGLCDTINFNGRDSIFRMLGNPILWSDTTQFTADTIDMYIKDKALDLLVLRTKALIISSVLETFYDQISGKKVVADIDSSAIQSMHVTGNAQSVYYVLDDDNAFVGVNQVVSSEIFFAFQQGRLDQIKFMTKPTGTMTPMELVDHNSLRLEGFYWRHSERPIILDDLF